MSEQPRPYTAETGVGRFTCKRDEDDQGDDVSRLLRWYEKARARRLRRAYRAGRFRR